MVSKSKDVFLVHGHDTKLRLAVTRFIKTLGLNPVILNEQPNKGRTIIEKFEQRCNVCFAIVLLSPDDEGKSRKRGNLASRARQNVILELGYFIAHLGRARVCALTVGSIEQPSDLLGVLNIPYDQKGAWKLALANELKAAGIELT